MGAAAVPWITVAAFVVALATLWTAALTPTFFPVWLRSPERLSIIAEHSGLWTVTTVLFATSAVVTLIATAMFVPAASSAYALPSLLVLTAGTGLWVTYNVFRATTLLHAAQGGSDADLTLLAAFEPWANGLWTAASILIIASFAGIGVALLGSTTVPAWCGWTVIGLAAGAAVLYIAIRDMPPLMAYLPLFPMAVAAILKAL